MLSTEVNGLLFLPWFLPVISIELRAEMRFLGLETEDECLLVVTNELVIELEGLTELSVLGPIAVVTAPLNT